MTVDKKMTEDGIIVKVTGRLDTVTSPELEKALESEIGNITDLAFDFSDLEYISSAGLRVLLGCRKAVSGQLSVRNCNSTVREIFEITGFSGIITLE